MFAETKHISKTKIPKINTETITVAQSIMIKGPAVVYIIYYTQIKIFSCLISTVIKHFNWPNSSSIKIKLLFWSIWLHNYFSLQTLKFNVYNYNKHTWVDATEAMVESSDRERKRKKDYDLICYTVATLWVSGNNTDCTVW